MSTRYTRLLNSISPVEPSRLFGPFLPRDSVEFLDLPKRMFIRLYMRKVESYMLEVDSVCAELSLYHILGVNSLNCVCSFSH